MNQPYEQVPTPAAQLGAMSDTQRAILKTQMAEAQRTSPLNDPDWASKADKGVTTGGGLGASFMKAALGTTLLKFGAGLVLRRQHTATDYLAAALGAGMAGVGKHAFTGTETSVKDGAVMGMGLEGFQWLSGSQGFLSAPIIAAIAAFAVPILGRDLTSVGGKLFGDKGFSFSSLFSDLTSGGGPKSTPSPSPEAPSPPPPAPGTESW